MILLLAPKIKDPTKKLVIETRIYSTTETIKYQTTFLSLS